MTCIIGTDVGGSFTDPSFSGDPGRCMLKVPSMPQDPSIGLLNSLESAGLASRDVNARRQQESK